MNTKTDEPAVKITFSILIILSLSHFFNDLLQSVISAAYPLFKEDLSLSFAQIGLITLVYQLAASVFQPLTGFLFDKHPISWSLPLGMTITMTGLINLAFATNLHWVLIAVFIIGIGSSILHPEASRIAFLASGGKRGLAQSLFQVGGNLGGSLGPLLVALLVAPYGRHNIILFAALALVAIVAMLPICKWYKSYLTRMKAKKTTASHRVQLPLPMDKTMFSIAILLVLIFSKYIYMASLTSYYTFYLMHKFGLTVQNAQLHLFAFLFAVAAGTVIGGPVGDKIGRKYVIWGSILGVAPFTLVLPYASLEWTGILTVIIGFILASAFSAILVYAQELLPGRIGMVSGLFFGFAFGMGGLGAAVLGLLADHTSIDLVYKICAFLPLLGFLTIFLPDNRQKA